jgi:xyloglucan-specific exo-beta-1,4-glucanase
MSRLPLRHWLLAAAALAPAACLTPLALRAESPGEDASPDGSGRVETAAYAWRNVQILGGGFVTGVTFSSTVKGLAYARTDIGGAYRLDPGSEKWVPLTDLLAILSSIRRACCTRRSYVSTHSGRRRVQMQRPRYH